MSKKRTYVSPRVIRVKLEPTQAVLSNCSGMATTIQNAFTTGLCEGTGHTCKQDHNTGDSAAAS